MFQKGQKFFLVSRTSGWWFDCSFLSLTRQRKPVWPSTLLTECLKSRPRKTSRKLDFIFNTNQSTRQKIQSTNHHDENKYKRNPFWENPSKACKSEEIENTIIFFGFVFILYFFRFHSWIQTPELNNNCSQSLQDHATNAMYFRDIQMYFRETQIRVLPNNNNNNIRRCAKVIF